jgi:hypothetical protein
MAVTDQILRTYSEAVRSIKVITTIWVPNHQSRVAVIQKSHVDKS